MSYASFHLNSAPPIPEAGLSDAKSGQPPLHSLPVHAKIGATVYQMRVDMDMAALHPDLGNIRETPYLGAMNEHHREFIYGA